MHATSRGCRVLPSTPMTVAPERLDVTLREITAETVRAICRLDVAPEQRRFVSSIAVSIAEAHFAPEAWFRAIYAGDEPVGFVMLSLEPEVSDFFLWRLLIDTRYQRRGYGAEAVRQVVEHVRALGARELQTSVVPGEGTPEPFYRGLGFVPTGAIEEGEIVLALALDRG